jgi:uncharacterized protein YraI
VVSMPIWRVTPKLAKKAEAAVHWVVYSRTRGFHDSSKASLKGCLRGSSGCTWLGHNMPLTALAQLKAIEAQTSYKSIERLFSLSK